MSFLTSLINGRMRFGCGLLGLVIALGTAGFYLLEDWSPLDSFFTTILVVSTLGFADLRPETAQAQVLTVGLIAAGVGTLYYLVGALAQTLIDNQLDAGRKRRMEQRIDRLENHFIVCGFGRVGQETCRHLAHDGRILVVIDKDPERVARIHAEGYLCLEGDASDDDVLRHAQIGRARALLTAVQSDAGNVYITLSARALNPRLFIVARAATPEAEHKLLIAGADRVISPYVTGGRGMANQALRPAVTDFLEMLMHSDDPGMWLEEIAVRPDTPLSGATVGELQHRDRSRLTVLAVRAASGEMVVNPAPEHVLSAGDTIVVLGSHGRAELHTAWPRRVERSQV